VPAGTEIALTIRNTLEHSLTLVVSTIAARTNWM
jgi:hypothetical protein